MKEMRMSLFWGLLLLACGLAAAWAAEEGGMVTESAREIPVAYQVDVVVVGGSTGAVAAAVEAAKSGAKVFLAAPRPYLGEDMCATLRLWLEDGEVPQSPLAIALFSASGETEFSFAAPAGLLAFKYETSLPSSGVHKDTAPPTRLSDGAWAKAETESVQYDGDVAVTCDLGLPQDVKSAEALLFHRLGGDFNPEACTIQTSDDKKSWKDVATVKCDKPQGPVVAAAANVGARARYVRFDIKKEADAKRLLLAEVRIAKPEGAAAPVPAPSAPKALARLVRPMHVKKTLDDALLAAKVDFLYSCFPTDVLRDAAGNLCGVVMANRAGRQAVMAKVVIDATERATVARLAGAGFQPYPAGAQIFKRVVVGGQPKDAAAARDLGLAFPAGNQKHALFEYTLRLPLKDGSFASFAKADQDARDATFHTGQVDASEVLFQVPPDPVKGVKSAAGAQAPSAAALDLDACRPAGVPRLFVLGGCADVPREQAEKLLRPISLLDLGARVGAAAAAEAKALPAVADVKVSAPGAGKAGDGDVKEFLSGTRPFQKGLPGVLSPARGVPVLGVYDVVVIGGGTGGAPAGIGAGRGGAKTLLVEYLHGLGGVGTLGMISKYYHGYRGGFTAEVDKGVKELGPVNEVVAKAEWWRRANRKAGTEVWFGVLGCGAYVEGDTVKGAVVVTPQGRGIVLAKTVIDSTGNADIAAAAGSQCDYTGGDDVGVQGTGLPPLNLGAGYTNTDWTFGDDTDVVDFWQLFVTARQKFKGAYDLGQLVDTRERRRIVGDATVSPMDIILGRRWPDTVVMAKSNFDSHGFTVHPIFVAMPPDHEGLTAFVPLRALLPKGLEGILVTGLGVSAHRDAMPVIRMQPDVQNQGYACGYAGAMVAKSAASVRGVDLKGLQKHLVDTGCLPAHVLTDQDSLPMPKERIAAAVAEVAKAPKGKAGKMDGVVRDRDALAIIFAHPRESVPLLEQACARADGDDKLAFAHILAMLGSQVGAETLIAKIRSASALDKGWNYTGMGQFGRSLSELDSYIVALGRTRDPRTLEAVLEKLKLLDAAKEFSHHRACAMALETLGDARAAGPLAELLSKPGMTGHAFTSIQAAREGTGASGTETKPRNESLRELILARALYRCGDKDGLGRKILQEYEKDLRGHYARHAHAVLTEKPGPK
jgi:hypothetical protein